MAVVPIVFLGDFRRGNDFFRDQDNVLATYKNKDTEDVYFVDWGRVLGDDDSVDTFTVATTGNVSVSGPASSGNLVNFGVSGSDGEVKVTIVSLLTDRTFIQTLRFIDTRV